MANRDVEIDILANDKTDRATRSARKNFEDLERDTSKIGTRIRDIFGKNIAGAVTDLSSSAGPALVGVIAAAAPLIGATISAAIIGGAGIGGVIGGVLLASRDPRVQSAGSSLGKNLMSSLTEDASVFIDPVLRSIDKIQAAFDQSQGHIKSIFSQSSGFLDPLVDGALSGVQSIIAGIDSLITRGQPVINAIGRSFSTLGDSIGQAFDIISGGSEDAGHAVDDLSSAMGSLIVTTAGVVRVFTELYGVVRYIPSKLSEFGNQIAYATGVADDFESSLTLVHKGLSPLESSIANGTTFFDQFGQAILTSAGPIQTFTDKVNALTNTEKSLFDATTNVGEALDRAAEAAKKNGKTLDANTEKGRANRTALSNLANALVAQYNATVQVNGEGIKSNNVAAQNRAAFIKQATAFGLSTTAAGKLATQMGLIPAKKNTDFHANTHDAEARIKALQDQVNGVHGKTVNVSVIVTQSVRRKVDNTLSRFNGGGFSANTFAGDSSGTHRTGGPNPVASPINNDVQVFVDGNPMRAEIRESQRKADFRSTVGRRYAYGR